MAVETPKYSAISVKASRVVDDPVRGTREG